MRGSIAAVLSYLDGNDPEAAKIARQRYGYIDRPVRRSELCGEMAIGGGIADNEKRCLTVPVTALVNDPQSSKTHEGLLDVVPGERSFPMFHLYVEATPFKLHLNIFIALDLDTLHR